MSRVLIGLLACLLPSIASSHAFGKRFDLPLPLWLYLTGAGLVVALSFIFAAFFLRESGWFLRFRGLDISGTRIGQALLAPVGSILLRSMSILLLLLVIAAGFVAQQNPVANFGPVFVWIIWWIGLTYIVALFGNLWDLLDPWRNLHAIGMKLTRSRGIALLDYPPWAAAWPAVLLLFGFTWLELISGIAHQPQNLAAITLLYTCFSLIGMVLFGRQAWLRNIDPFNLVFGMMAKFGILRGENGRLTLRMPGAGLVQAKPRSFSLMAFVVLMLTTVSYDGFTETPLWANIQTSVYNWAFSLETLKHWFSPVAMQKLILTLALLVLYFLFIAIYLGVSLICFRLSTRPTSVTETACAYVLSLVPIAIAYHLAHYLSYLLLSGQLIIPLLSDPLDLGWNLFGGARYRVDIGIIDVGDTWYLAVFAIVIGHVIAVCISHATALQREAGQRQAVISQLPMLVLMVAYTMISLWILSQPIVS